MIRASGYDIASYGEMIDCEPRMGVYVEALRRAVTPGCTVIDLGAGFGVFAILACKFGAGEVIAIEPDPSIELLMPLAKANGCAERITVVRDLSTRFTPERKADVIVSDCRGTVNLYEHHIATIKDARERLLAPGGTLLPMRDTLKVALAHSPKIYRHCHYPWRSNRYGLDLSAALPFAANTETKAYLKPRALLGKAQDLAIIDYRTVTEPNVDSTVELVAQKRGIAHGLLVWFDAEIAEGLGYSNAPGEPELVYGQMFLPFADPPRLKAGDRVKTRFRANLVENNYVWVWEGATIDSITGETRNPFRQSSFMSRVLSKNAAAAGSSLAVPQRSVRMQIDADCLAMVDGGTDHDGIAKVLMERYPQELPSYRAALDHVVSLMARYA
ncbi:MAG: 50S ribosomal protein L11 methyltransferase [Erythrobacter sp.]